MAKVDLKGIIRAVFPVEYVGEKGTAKQVFHLLVPGYTDEFGDKKGIDEIWEISIMGDKVTTLGMAGTSLQKKAKCSLFVNSKEVSAKDNPLTKYYIINATLSAIEIL